MYLFLQWIGLTLIVIFTAWIIPGISVKGFPTAMAVAVVIALINMFIKPLLVFITLPINILTLGLFTLVINAFLLMFTAYLVPGFSINGFWSAFFGAIIISVLTIGLNLR